MFSSSCERTLIHSATAGNTRRVKQVTYMTRMIQALADLDFLVLARQSKATQDGPTIGMLQNRATQIVRRAIAA